MRLRAPRLRVLLLQGTVILHGASACRTWQRAPLPRGRAPASALADHARLTRTNGRVDEVAHAQVDGDTVRAERYHFGRGQALAAVVVPLDSVRALEVRRVSWPRTLGLAAGVFGVLYTLNTMLSGYNGR